MEQTTHTMMNDVTNAIDIEALKPVLNTLILSRRQLLLANYDVALELENVLERLSTLKAKMEDGN